MLYSLKDTQRYDNIFEKNIADFRSEYRRDYDRILHAPSFRRLQNKTQLFPGSETDYFRNRLTHSLEVGQIAKDIANNINHNNEYFKVNNINLDIVEAAGIAHDLGHPPFGHNGEKALNVAMKGAGGFEGNAQTLRIVAKLEKRQKIEYSNFGISSFGKDERLGLNLTSRVIASILKYDNQIPKTNRSSKVIKGYYFTEKEVVDFVKGNVANGYKGKFKTIECQIMDIADDIAYSTYDLEDAFKAGFLSPFECLSINDSVANNIASELNNCCSLKKDNYTNNDIRGVLYRIFGFMFTEGFPEGYTQSEFALEMYNFNTKIIKDGYMRSILSSMLVSGFVGGVRINVNEDYPVFSECYLEEAIREEVEVLKRLAYCKLISSHLLKVPEYRGFDIVTEIFNALNTKEGVSLLPFNFRSLIDSTKDTIFKKRIVCDFVAGMTDRYALEFYGRLKGNNPQTIFKPI